jgi:hypothetical protein
MKQNYIEVQVQNQIQQSIQDAFYGSNQTILNEKIIRSAVLNHPPVGGAGGRPCKGPPGQARSPGARGDPKHPPDTFGNENNNHFKTEFQIINTYQILNYYKHLNFIIMKKQILFLAFFVLASFASITTAFGQEDLTATPDCPIPNPIDPTCLSADALHPIPGTAYTYSVTVPNIVTGTGTYTWFVTQDMDFITSGTLTSNMETPGAALSHMLDASTELNTATADLKEISITWKSFVYDDAAPVFVVIHVVGTDAADCPVNNLKVYKIEPVQAFTLDIASVNVDGTTQAYGTPAESCFPEIVSAEYVVANDAITYDFGVSYAFFAVTAANFNTSWRANFEVGGLDAKQELINIHWQRPGDATWTATTAPGTLGSHQIDEIPVVDASGAVGADGECIVVRVTVAHHNYEGIAAQTFTLAVDGETELAATTVLKDLHHLAGTDCGKDDGFDNDIAEHTFNPRPEINSTTPVVAPEYPDVFLPIAP